MQQLPAGDLHRGCGCWQFLKLCLLQTVWRHLHLHSEESDDGLLITLQNLQDHMCPCKGVKALSSFAILRLHARRGHGEVRVQFLSTRPPCPKVLSRWMFHCIGGDVCTLSWSQEHALHRSWGCQASHASLRGACAAQQRMAALQLPPRLAVHC